MFYFIFWRESLPFIATLPESKKYSATWTSLTSLENWWSQTLDKQKNQDSHAQIEQILATIKQQLAGMTLGFFQELPFSHL